MFLPGIPVGARWAFYENQQSINRIAEVIIMPSITEEQLDILLSLQEIENESGRIKTLLSGVSREIDERNSKLADFEKRLKSEESEYDRIKSEVKSLEEDIRTYDERINKSQEHLRTVGTNKEYQVLLREIDDNKKRNSAMEDEVLQRLEILEKAEKTVGTIRGEYDQLASMIKGEIEEIETNSVEERQSYELIMEKRKTIAVEVAPDLLKRFEILLKQSRGVAIAPVKKGMCCGCYMNIPPQMYNELQAKDTLYFCPHCHRMIYYREEPVEEKS